MLERVSFKVAIVKKHEDILDIVYIVVHSVLIMGAIFASEYMVLCLLLLVVSIQHRAAQHCGIVHQTSLYICTSGLFRWSIEPILEIHSHHAVYLRLSRSIELNNNFQLNGIFIKYLSYTRIAVD